MRPKADRVSAWDQLAGLVDESMLTGIAHEIGLEHVIETATALLEGKVRGRVVVTLD